MTYRSTSFEIHKGDNKTLQITIRDPDGVVVPLTNYEARFTIKTTPDATTYVLRKATVGIGGGADVQMKVTVAASGILQVYILQTDLVTFSTCTITALAAASITNDEGFTLIDTHGTSVLFKFNKDGAGVTGSPDVTLAITTGETASQVATIIQTGVDGHASFTSSAPGAAVVTVSQAVPGLLGNRTNTDTVTDTGFIVAAFTGGLDTPSPGTYYYEVELEDASNNRFTVLQSTFPLLAQLTDWADIS